MDELLRRVLAKDYTAPKRAKQLGPPAVPELVNLLHDPDDEVRQIAVYCLDDIGGPAAAAALVPVLLDPDTVIAASAARALHHHPDPGAYPALLHVFDRRPDPYVLHEIPLIIGRMGPAVGTRDLAEREAIEGVPEAKEGLVTALAKLGDPKAREDFATLLAGSSGPDRKRLLDLAEYIHEAWLLKPLGKVLDDPSPMLRVGVDARPDLIDTLRACDLGVSLIASIGKVTFSFPVNHATNYAPEQLDEVKAFVASLP